MVTLRRKTATCWREESGKGKERFAKKPGIFVKKKEMLVKIRRKKSKIRILKMIHFYHS